MITCGERGKIVKDYKGIVFFDYDGTLIDEVDGIFGRCPIPQKKL